MPLQNILTYNEELELASYKVDDVQRPTEELSWKLKHSPKCTTLWCYPLLEKSCCINWLALFYAAAVVPAEIAGPNR
jgi:hypothetical protein